MKMVVGLCVIWLLVKSNESDYNFLDYNMES